MDWHNSWMWIHARIEMWSSAETPPLPLRLGFTLWKEKEEVLSPYSMNSTHLAGEVCNTSPVGVFAEEEKKS